MEMLMDVVIALSSGDTEDARSIFCRICEGQGLEKEEFKPDALKAIGSLAEAQKLDVGCEDFIEKLLEAGGALGDTYGFAEAEEEEESPNESTSIISPLN